MSRLRDSQLAAIEGSEKVKDIHNYIVKGVLWQAFTAAAAPVVLLIDEIDKADIEFPEHDLLREIDRMEFYVYETRELVKRARHRPLVFITSNNEKELPRQTPSCAAASSTTSSSPTPTTMKQHRFDVHFPDLKKELLGGGAEETSSRCATCPAWKKKPSTSFSELLDWPEAARRRGHPARGARQSKDDDKVAMPPLVKARCSRTSRT